MPEDQIISIGEKIKEAGRHSIIYGLGSVAQSAITLILLPILTGALSKDDFGAYSLIVMVSTIASAVFYLGITSALPRSYFDYESSEDRRSVFTTAFVVLLSGAMLQVIIGYLYATDIALLLTGSKDYGIAVAWALFGGALSFVNQYFFAYLRILRKSTVSVLFSLFSLSGTIGLTLILLESEPSSVVVPFEAIAYVQFVLIAVFLSVYGKMAFIWQFKFDELPKLLHFGVASIIASSGQMLMEWIDRLIIEHYMSLADVGVYSAAFRVGMLVNVLLVLPFTQIWTPMMMEYRNKSNIRELFRNIFSLFMMIGGILVIASSLFAYDILELLIKYDIDQSMITILILVVLGALIFSSVNFFSAGLFYERKVYRLSYVYYSVFVIKSVINIALIPLLGLIGAAISALVAYTLVPIWIYLISRKYFSFEIDWSRLFPVVLISLPSLLYGLFGGGYYDLPVFIRLFWLLVSIILIYMTCFEVSERTTIVRYVKGNIL